MPFISVLGLAVALAMDAFAVSIATGIYLEKVSFRQTFRLSWHFGLFQALMPLAGWSAALTVRTLIANFAPWVAFFLLAFVGGNMIRAALKPEKEDEYKKDPTKGSRMVILSVATSIDALTVGFSLSILKVSILFPALIIGLVATIFTAAGMHLGQKIGLVFKVGKIAEIIGGLVLLTIGFDILRRHGVF